MEPRTLLRLVLGWYRAWLLLREKAATELELGEGRPRFLGFGLASLSAELRRRMDRPSRRKDRVAGWAVATAGVTEVTAELIFHRGLPAEGISLLAVGLEISGDLPLAVGSGLAQDFPRHATLPNQAYLPS